MNANIPKKIKKLEVKESPSFSFDFICFVERRYSNLCALCEDPVKCNYPDKYSGYEGAIRCLAENGGDVAFTKVIYVRKFFGVSGFLND